MNDDREYDAKVQAATEDMIRMRDPDHRSRQQRRFEERKGPREPDKVAQLSPRAVSSAKLMALVGDRRDPTDPAVWGGRLNIYVCDGCRRHIVTRDVDQGVTPFMLPANPYCPGDHPVGEARVMMVSCMYRVANQSMREDYQWYAPGEAERAAASPHSCEHYDKGGLAIRKAVFEGEGS